MEDIKSTVAKQIAALRAQNGMTQLELAEQLHYSDKAVSKWERGESIPELATLVAIADLFDVTLDELIRNRKPAEASASSVSVTDKKKHANRSIVTAISILLVWFLASLAFVVLDLLPSDVHHHWLAFIYAIPISAIVWLVLNSVWFNRRRNYLIISLLTWSLLAAIHISFVAFSINIWQVYLLGAPGQLVILLWSGLYRKKARKTA